MRNKLYFIIFIVMVFTLAACAPIFGEDPGGGTDEPWEKVYTAQMDGSELGTITVNSDDAFVMKFWQGEGFVQSQMEVRGTISGGRVLSVSTVINRQRWYGELLQEQVMQTPVVKDYYTQTMQQLMRFSQDYVLIFGSPQAVIFTAEGAETEPTALLQTFFPQGMVDDYDINFPAGITAAQARNMVSFMDVYGDGFVDTVSNEGAVRIHSVTGVDFSTEGYYDGKIILYGGREQSFRAFVGQPEEVWSFSVSSYNNVTAAQDATLQQFIESRNPAFTYILFAPDNTYTMGEVTPDMVSGWDSSELGEIMLTVSFTHGGNEYTDELYVTIYDPDNLKVTSFLGASIAEIPSFFHAVEKNENVTGRLSAHYLMDNGSMHEVQLLGPAITLSGLDTSKTGAQLATLTYGGRQDKVLFYVYDQTDNPFIDVDFEMDGGIFVRQVLLPPDSFGGYDLSRIRLIYRKMAGSESEYVTLTADMLSGFDPQNINTFDGDYYDLSDAIWAGNLDNVYVIEIPLTVHKQTYTLKLYVAFKAA